MVEKSQYLSDLTAFRELYREERRGLVANALRERKANGDGGLWGAELRAVQEILDAIDRAITDEKRLAPTDPVAFSVPAEIVR